MHSRLFVRVGGALRRGRIRSEEEARPGRTSAIARGFDHLTLDPSPRLRQMRERLEAESGARREPADG
jgi:hypothetical protein